MSEPDVMAILAKRITLARLRKGLSQQDLAKEAGSTYQTIWRIEKGMHKDASVLLVRALARALGVSVDYLVNTYDEDSQREAGVEVVGAAHDTGSTAATETGMAV